MSHHTVPYHDDSLEPAKDLTYLRGSKPAHVTVPGDEWGIEPDTTAGGVCVEEGGAVWAEGGEGVM